MRAKAHHFKVQLDEIVSRLFILVSERLNDFNPGKGSAEAFFFGLLHAELTRYFKDVCCHASTLSHDSPAGLAYLEAVSYSIALGSEEPCFTNTNGFRQPAGISSLRTLADAASGKSAQQIASHLKVGRRRVNQILKKKRDISVVQHSFDF